MPMTDSPVPHHAGGSPGAGEVRAYIDLGTNSVRLILARFHGGCAYTVLSDQKEAVRLGEDEFTDGYLRRAAIWLPRLKRITVSG